MGLDLVLELMESNTASGSGPRKSLPFVLESWKSNGEIVGKVTNMWARLSVLTSVILTYFLSFSCWFV